MHRIKSSLNKCDHKFSYQQKNTYTTHQNNHKLKNHTTKVSLKFSCEMSQLIQLNALPGLDDDQKPASLLNFIITEKKHASR